MRLPVWWADVAAQRHPMIIHGFSHLASTSCDQGPAVALAVMSDSLSLAAQNEEELLPYTIKRWAPDALLVAAACPGPVFAILTWYVRAVRREASVLLAIAS